MGMVDLDLPETLTQQIEDPEGKLTLSIDLSRRLSIDGAPVKWTELKDKLATNDKLRRERELFIAADKDLPYAVVITAMAAAQQAGVVKLQMLTDSTQELDLSQLENLAGAAGPAPAQ